MKILYEAIQERFKEKETQEIFEELKLRAPEYIDLYNGQPEEPNQFEFTLPALFIDYAIDWDKEGTMRIGTLTVEVHVLTDPTDETDNISLIPGLDKIVFYETISDLLENIATSETSKLVLKNEIPVVTDYFNYHKLTFTCTISRRRSYITKERIHGVEISRKPYSIDIMK